MLLLPADAVVVLLLLLLLLEYISVRERERERESEWVDDEPGVVLACLLDFFLSFLCVFAAVCLVLHLE